VKKGRRVGNGWLGRAATRGRMRSHDLGYVGSEKALGHASIRKTAQSWRYGKAADAPMHRYKARWQCLRAHRERIAEVLLCPRSG
jgi:hypothetical protein